MSPAFCPDDLSFIADNPIVIDNKWRAMLSTLSAVHHSVATPTSIVPFARAILVLRQNLYLHIFQFFILMSVFN